jgi:putative ABC transport system permease protein
LTILLAATSGISLVVGGIGIMNIMLVAVTERTKEIGLRKALGASQKDILVQFIIESVILSVAGGLVGIGIGVSGVLILAALTSFETGISVAAIAISSGVSGAIGLFFGVFPAKQAAKLDPIVALRSM